MTPETIREARRILHDLVFKGEAVLSTGRLIEPDDDHLVPLLEKIAGKKLEEVVVPPILEDFSPKETHHVREKGFPFQEGGPGSAPS